MRCSIYETQYQPENTVKWKKKKQWWKFKRNKCAVKSQLGSSKVSNFVELALQCSKFNDITVYRKQRNKNRIGLQKEKIQLDQLLNSEFEKENISKTSLTAQRRSLISDVVLQSNGIITFEKKHHFAWGWRRKITYKSSYWPKKGRKKNHGWGNYRERKKSKKIENRKARIEGSIVGQSVLVADQELGMTELSKNNSSLVDIFSNLLNDENLVIVINTPSSYKYHWYYLYT